MSVSCRLRSLFFLIIFVSPVTNAGIYLALAPSLIRIKTDAGGSSPKLADIRLGYALDEHKFELAAMTGIMDSNLNQLITEIPAAVSLFYRYTLTPRNPLRFDVILGYSQIDIRYSYVAVPDATQTFQGVSYGIGLEEALKSIPQLKFKLDLMQLYRGDQLTLNLLSMGFRYDF